jgi:hypothetical protein
MISVYFESFVFLCRYSRYEGDDVNLKVWR